MFRFLSILLVALFLVPDSALAFGKGRHPVRGLLQKVFHRNKEAAVSAPASVVVPPALAAKGYKPMPVGDQVYPDSYQATAPKGPEFSVGQRVQHVANCCGKFPAGTGRVTSVTIWNTGDGFSYQVRCDKTGKVLPVNFKASELTAR